MKGAKLYKVEIWHYADGPEDAPQNDWPGPPVSTTTIPDCESFEIDFKWQDDIGSQSGGPYPDHLGVHGVIKTYSHQAAFFLIGQYPIEAYMHIGDCLLLYYQTDDGERFRYRFNGVYFGAPWLMRTYLSGTVSKGRVDTGESPHSVLSWILARFHHDNPEPWNTYALRVIHQWWDGNNWVAAPLPGPNW